MNETKQPSPIYKTSPWLIALMLAIIATAIQAVSGPMRFHPGQLNGGTPQFLALVFGFSLVSGLIVVRLYRWFTWPAGVIEWAASGLVIVLLVKVLETPLLLALILTGAIGVQ